MRAAGPGLAAIGGVLCPNCRTSVVVRASVFDDRFWTNLAVITLPLLILALVAVLLYRVGLPSAPSRWHEQEDFDG